MTNIAQLVKELIEGGSSPQRVTEVKKHRTGVLRGFGDDRDGKRVKILSDQGATVTVEAPDYRASISKDRVRFDKQAAPVEEAKKPKSERRITYKGKGIEKLFPSGMYEFYSDAKKRFLKFDDLGDAKAAIDAESSVSEAKKRTVFDPVSKKKVPVKSIKTKAGGPVTRNGNPVPDEELKPKDRFKKKQQESTDPADIGKLVTRLLEED
jgi:hypothetical protein